MSSITNLAGNLLQSVLGSSSLSSIAAGAVSGSSSTASSALSTTFQPDSGHLSSFGHLVSELQQLQQSNPGEYQQLTKQIAANLQTAAQNAQTGGNTAAATQLNQLASDFTTASSSGQLPNLQDLAQAVGGGHHGHRHGGGNYGGSTDTSAAATDPLNPANIIQNALATAGVSSSLAS